MSDEQLKPPLVAVNADASLQEQLTATADAHAVVTIAKEANPVISAEELMRAQASVNQRAQEISEEELEDVVGVLYLRGHGRVDLSN